MITAPGRHRTAPQYRLAPGVMLLLAGFVLAVGAWLVLALLPVSGPLSAVPVTPEVRPRPTQITSAELRGLLGPAQRDKVRFLSITRVPTNKASLNLRDLTTWRNRGAD